MHTWKHMNKSSTLCKNAAKSLFLPWFVGNQVHLWQSCPVCKILGRSFFNHNLVITLKISWHWMTAFSDDLIHLRSSILKTSRILMAMCSILYICVFLSFLKNFLSQRFFSSLALGLKWHTVPRWIYFYCEIQPPSSTEYIYTSQLCFRLSIRESFNNVHGGFNGTLLKLGKFSCGMSFMASTDKLRVQQEYVYNALDFEKYK